MAKSPNPWEIPIKTYLAQRPNIFGVVSSAIIIHDNHVLLVQRAADDDEPNLWETPGGTADADETGVQCAVRELREEVGLVASRVGDMIGEYEWIEDGTKLWRIFMFLVDVDGITRSTEIKLDPREHQAYLWATETEVRQGICGGIRLNWISESQDKAILTAFDIYKLRSS